MSPGSTESTSDGVASPVHYIAGIRFGGNMGFTLANLPHKDGGPH